MTAITSDTPRPSETVSGWLTLLLAASCGLIVANIYYAQPLVGPISAELGLSPRSAGLIVTMTQVGYGVGLLLIVPLGDLVENRRLVLSVIGLGALALLGAALSTNAIQFLGAALLIGLGSVGVQILIPYAGHMAPEAIRGRVVGNVTTGLMIGVMLSRPLSSFIAAISSWHVVYGASAAAMVVLALVLRWMLPARVPSARLSYGKLLGSMVQLARTTPVLRRRGFYQACLFGAFSLFWTTVPLLLADPRFTSRNRGSHCLPSLASRALSRPRSPVASRIAAGPGRRRRSR